MADLDKIRAQAAALEQYEQVEAAIARVEDALAQAAHVYHVEATDHALSHRSIEFSFTSDESIAILGVLKTTLQTRLATVKSAMEG